MLLLFIYNFFLSGNSNRQTKQFMCGRIVQSHWQVSQRCNLPQPGPGKPDTKEMLCALLHLRGGELASSERKASSKRWLWNQCLLWYHTDILTYRVSQRYTFNVYLSPSACRTPIASTLIPLSSHISSQGMMQQHWKCACTYYRLQYKIRRHLEIYFRPWRQAEWLNMCQRFMMNSEVSSFKRQHSFL